ncbi:MAG TPA: UDP-N-acetylglucosamine 2-epimerase (hydrolyzing) [Lentisphaeria bacterium]|nr:MAG: UDP-N-acetyl-D-glucosamine 2-epimerase, UDP-hydrolysing [Lentisphaerae bacterium GWF2_38_69]HBM15418.1 UDP-N-acetylglucosamine 2-epimerase (hydrolyzing) [Lentisphaeria bacterium]
MKNKVCIITATRAEYGYLRSLAKRLKQSDRVKLQIIATGTHLEKKYGYTLSEIIQDGFNPDATVPILKDDSPLGVLSTMSNAITKVGESLKKLSPDMVVLLGDRYETVSIALACTILGIPIAHIGGGDVTCGAYDDMFRHALTKLSCLHFVSCEEYRKRVIQLGENPKRVFTVGALSVENVLTMKLLSKEQMQGQFDFPIEDSLLATFHPVTMGRSSQEKQFNELLSALQTQQKYNVIFTRPNADTDRSALDKMLNVFAKKNLKRVKVVDSLGIVSYLSVMKYCAGVIGNSSSGIVEAPSLKKGSIDIGNRQKGRISAGSVIHCPAKRIEILKALDVLGSDKFQKGLKSVVNMYEKRNTSQKIVKVIEDYIDRKSEIKEFYDLRGDQ